jgi:hypothetical protein
MGLFSGARGDQSAREPSKEHGHGATREGYKAGNTDPSKRGLAAEVARVEQGTEYER